MLLNSLNLYLKKFVIIIFLSISFQNFAQEIAILKYNGGGDWYANPTALPNLIGFSNKHINTLISENPRSIAVDNSDLFNYPIVFMTGHGNVYFTEEEAKNLREYLISGGFLHISDNYGLDKYIRRELKKVFSKIELQEIPNNHPIYNQTFIFKNGLPKIHEHDKKEPKGFGLFFKGRLVCFYDYESDLSDGWEDASIHNNPEEIRLKALQMGSNIIEYAFKN